QFTILASDPVAVIEFDPASEVCPFSTLAKHMAAYPSLPASANSDFFFPGGWIGYFTYESGMGMERIPCQRESGPKLPGVRFGLYDAVALFNHATWEWWIAGVDWPAGSVGRARVEKRLEAVRNRLIASQSPPPDNLIHIPRGGEASANMSSITYMEKVRRIKRYIEAGDVYQISLSQRFETRTAASPIDLYRTLRRKSPSSRAAFLSWDDTAILSASPELFLDLRRGQVLTRPIKGTRPRSDDPALDAHYRCELVASEKDRAELNMIVDLLRNDLGRACDYGSVRVLDANEIEAHPTVYHRVATIEGTLRREYSWVDLLRATFPGGSITGAPKIRAMQIISELEPTPRGVYCGSIDWIGLDGSMSLNIAIRTMVQTGDVVHIHAGGAVVADSDPLGEYEEMLAKAKAMLETVGYRAADVTSPPHRSLQPS
ncbi:MAG: anthranilate synthase component I family protein, partial [Gammaproteobacteria bacterium]|nr:anthranilate synthase component I family protein [Gammaproteobacteria bacterium]